MKNLFFIIILLLFSSSFLFGQEKTAQIRQKDFHSVAIMDMELTHDGNFLYTSDEDGKVLKFDTENFEFISTIKQPTGIPVLSMKIMGNDTILMMSQKYLFSFVPQNDSLVYSFVRPPKILNKKSISFVHCDLGRDDLFGTLERMPNGTTQFSVFDRFSQQYLTLNLGLISNSKVAVNSTLEEIAAIDISMAKKINIYSSESGQLIRSIDSPNHLELIDVFYDEQDQLMILTFNSKSGKAEIYMADSQKLGKPVYSLDIYTTSQDRVVSRIQEGTQIISISNHPIVIKKKGDKFDLIRIPVDGKVAKTAINPVKNQLILASDGYNKNRIDFIVYDYKRQKITHQFPKYHTALYNGVFMANDAWAVYPSTIELDNSDLGKQLKVSSDFNLLKGLKYYESGTFKNRFSNLPFPNYLTQQFQIVPLRSYLFPEQDIALIYGHRKTSNYDFYAYHFSEDRLSEVYSNEKETFINVIDYNSQRNYLIVADRFYTNLGYTPSIQIKLVKNGKAEQLPGDYKFAKLSMNGDYLLTIDKTNNLSILKTDSFQKLFTKALTEGSYTVFATDSSDFAVSNDFRYRKQEECNSETYMLSINNDEVFEQTSPCSVINDLAQKNQNAATIFNDFGIGVGVKVKAFTQSDFPQTITFNDDASKFMLSHKDGRISVNDSETLEPLGYMIHLNGQEHIFYDTKNHFFSNINPEQFLYVERNGESIPLKQVEEEYFNPEEILELFGKPDEDYLTALQKALKLRRYNKSQIVEEPENRVTQKSLKKPNLYFVSIGVSNYENSSYSLTLANKDAEDMARIYGKYSDQEISNYNTKYYGNKYTIYNQKEHVLGKMSNYWEAGEYLYELRPLNEKIWIGGDYNTYSIWDFEKNTINKMSLPSFGYTVFHEDLIHRSPDGKEFYVYGEDGFYAVDFSGKAHLNPNISAKIQAEDFALLADNRWLHFNNHTLWDTLAIEVHDLLAERLIKTTRVPLDSTLVRNKEGELEKIEVIRYSPNFIGTSSDGHYLVYDMGLYKNETPTPDVYFVDLTQENCIPIQLPIHKERDDKVGIDTQQKVITYAQEIENKLFIYTYDFQGILKKTETLNSKDLFYDFLPDGKLYFLKQEKPLFEKQHYFNFIENEEVYFENNPPSFEKTFVKHLIDEEATKENIITTLNNFFKNASPEDQVMIFVAGHGLLGEENKFYFAPQDMDFENIKKQGISFEELTNSLANSPAQNKLLLIDACHSGKTIDLDTDIEFGSIIDKGERGAQAILMEEPAFKLSDITSNLFEDFLSKSGVTILSAASGGDLAQEHLDWGHGAFTKAYIESLLENLKEPMLYGINKDKLKEDVILQQKFMDDLHTKVIELTKGKQIPDLREINKDAVIRLW